MDQNIELRIAELSIILEARDSQINLTVPCCHEPFVVINGPNPKLEESKDKILILQVRDQEQFQFKKTGSPIVESKVWELWEQEGGGYVFISPKQVPPKKICIDPSFHCGEIFGDFSSCVETHFYPLSSIDIRIMVNWLATKGDLILHASGMIVDDRGYCFIGDSGAGKSTIIHALAEEEGVKVLGEDQVILRYLDGAFWIFGTPWHENPEYVSPDGARLQKIFILNRGINETTKPMEPSSGVNKILQTAFLPYYLPDKIGKIIDRLGSLAEAVPFFELHYRLGFPILPNILEK